MKSKSDIQSDQYHFPYHYLVDLETAKFGRNLDWGLDYYTYMRKVRELVTKYIRDDVLDVGCGDGFLLHDLARHTDVLEGRQAVGIDIDGKAIRFAQAFTHDVAQVTFVEQDLSTYDRRHTLITSVETFEHIPDEQVKSFAGQIDRILSSGGHLIVSVPSAVRPVIEKHYRHYDLPMLQACFPSYETIEVHYVTARRSPLYKMVARLLANRYVNLNFGPFKQLLLGIHSRFTSEVGADRGAHIVAVFRKP